MKEIEYQVDELLFKMNAMSHEHSMPEKVHGYLGDSDGTQGMMEDSISCASSDVSFILVVIYILDYNIYPMTVLVIGITT